MKGIYMRRTANAGFTLLELTCAIFIISVAGFGAIQLYSLGMDKIVELHEGDVALEILRNEVELLRARPFDALESTDSFSTQTEALEALHDATINVDVAATDVPGLKAIQVSLRWRSLHGRWIDRSLSTLIADKGAAP